MLVLVAILAAVSSVVSATSISATSSTGVTYNGLVDPATGHSRYLGIRYAQAPTGANRFKHPVAYTASSPYTATNFGAACYQAVGASGMRSLEYDFPTDAEGGYLASSFSEDCLFLNVYVPKTATPTSKLPVLVYVFGGSFTSGYSGLPSANANLTIQNGNNMQANGANAIIVTFNYRLGVFGWLADSFLQSEGSLNSGLFDQKMAFQWVKANIAGFGGNPANINAFSHSAGAISLGVHMLSYNGNQTLFNRAILNSGGPVLLYSTANATGTPQTIAAKTPCSTSPTVTCLRTLTPFQLMKAQFVVGPSFLPVLDGAMVTQQTSSSISNGQFSKIPLLVNSMQFEGSLFSMPPFSSTVVLFDSIVDLGDYLYPTSNYNDPAQGTNYTNAQTGDFFGDLLFRCPEQVLSQALTKANVPIYASLWTYKPAKSIYSKFYPPSTPFPSNLTLWQGTYGTTGYLQDITDATHGSELAFVWNFNYGGYLTTAEQAFSAKVINYYMSFINGNAPWTATYGSSGNLFDMYSGAVHSDSYLNLRCWAIEALAGADAAGTAAIAAVQTDIANLVSAGLAAEAAAAKLASWF